MFNSGISSELGASAEAMQWFESLPVPTIEEGEQILAQFELAWLAAVGRRLRLRTGVRSSLPFEDRADVERVTTEIQDLIDAGHASTYLLAHWYRHLFEERHGYQLDQGKHCLTITRELPERKRELHKVRVQLVPTLGCSMAAASFVGPKGIKLVLSEEVLMEEGHVDNLEAEFRIWHHYVHVTQGHLPFEGFGWRPEYKRDVNAPDLISTLSDPFYRDEEARVNVAATRFMWDDYVDNQFVFDRSQGLVRSATQISHPNTWVMKVGRLLSHPPMLGDEATVPLLKWSFWRLISATRPKPSFSSNISIVREHWWSPIYLVWDDAQGVKRRRWIPSRSILYRLGLRLSEVEHIAASQLSQYKYDGLLIDPEEVVDVRKILSECTIPITPSAVVASAATRLIRSVIQAMSECAPVDQPTIARRLPTTFLQRHRRGPVSAVAKSGSKPVEIPEGQRTLNVEVQISPRISA